MPNVFLFGAPGIPPPAPAEQRYVAVFVGELGDERDAVATTRVQIAPPRPAQVCRGPFSDCILVWDLEGGRTTLILEGTGTGNSGTVLAQCLDRCGRCGAEPGDACYTNYPVAFEGETTLAFTAPAPRAETSSFSLVLSVQAGGYVCIFDSRTRPTPGLAIGIGGFGGAHCPE